ncbi:hypothetical protein QYE76_071218 [Lolium multiflorum]|uniref:Transposase (putative) gypsy type domain-containing protein n=1 Tax=Lolium multiflorum TaxID=4521 RepID=A0AAD8SL83_LOLMU|nr:hypothetical protein QYE76_071218 [Lolium multiflorum]
MGRLRLPSLPEALTEGAVERSGTSHPPAQVSGVEVLSLSSSCSVAPVRAPSRRHGAPRLDAAFIAAAPSSGEERFLFSLRSRLVFFLLLFVHGLRQRVLEGLAYEQRRHRALVRLAGFLGRLSRERPARRWSQAGARERVVFGAHLDRGLGLPASAFFAVLGFLRPPAHHLPANACVLLSCYVAFMEGYAGLWPDVDFWGRLFYLKSQMTEGRLRTCGCASIYPRAGSLFPKIPTVDSVKNWQMTFFYVKNANPAFDRINLPEYNPAPPTTRLNWGHNPSRRIRTRSAEDLLCTYIERRVIPLQRRVHKIGLMSGRLDPTRTSRIALTKAQVAHRVNNITKANLPEDWAWGLPP